MSDTTASSTISAFLNASKKVGALLSVFFFRGTRPSAVGTIPDVLAIFPFVTSFTPTAEMQQLGTTSESSSF